MFVKTDFKAQFGWNQEISALYLQKRAWKTGILYIGILKQLPLCPVAPFTDMI